MTRLYLERIRARNGALGAFVDVYGRSALRDARAKDAAVRRGETLPAFHGVPTAVKDLNLVRGRWTRFGSRAVQFWSPVDDRSAASLRRGGFVLLGKTATSELGAMPVTETDLHPPCRNPWDPSVTAGGSSGGAAAAVAAGLIPIAHGSDGGGSIRIPSSLCHLYGIKPSRGRVPNAYGFHDEHIIYTCGPIARGVRDAAALLDVLAGLDVGRPHRLPAPPEHYARLVENNPQGLRIRLTLHGPITQTHPQVAEAVQRVARVLEELGHHVEEAAAPGGSVDEFLPIWQRQVATAPVLFPSRLQPVTRWLRDAGRAITDAQALEVQQRMSARILQVLEGADLWLTPTIPVPPPAVGAWKDLPPAEAFHRAATLGAFTAPCNLTGAPAASIPAGLLDGRWPMGAQLAGHVGDEATVLAVSRQLEVAMPWRDRWAATAR
ncbi:MAG: amidase [Deltaproteobacteria bacterium]|nr:amidase [Deltaproteobacteria bacterium]